MRLISVVKVAAAAGVAVTVGLIAAVKSIDFNKYKGFITEQVQAATGRELTIGGPLKLKLGLTPRLTLQNLSFANAAWGARRPMATVERIEAEVALLPLLIREVRIRRLVVIHPDLLLESDPGGRGNWELAAAPAEKPPGTAPATRFEISEVRIEDARLAYRQGDRTTVLALDRMRVEPDHGGRLSLTLTGTYDGTRFELGGLAGAPALMAAGKPYPLQLKGAIEGAVVVLDGAVQDPLAGKGIDLKLGASGDELADVARLMGVAGLPPIGPYRLSTRLSDASGHLVARDIDAAVGRRDALLVSAKGEIKNLTGPAGLDLAVAAESDNLAGLSRLAGTDIPAVGPLRLAGRLTDLKGGWRLADIKASLGKSDLVGELSLALGGAPKLTGRLASAGFSLADLTTAPAKPGEQVKPVHQRPAAKPADARLFPDAPLPVGALSALDAELAVAVGRLTLGSTTLAEVAMDLRLAGGRLRISPFTALLAGGRLDAELSLDGAAKPSRLDARLGARGVDLGRLMREASGSDALSGGRSDLSLDLKGQGASPRAIMAALNGTALLTVGEGRVNNTLLDWAGGDVLMQLAGSLNPLAKSEDTTRLHCAVARFVVKDGLATADRGIAVETAKVDVVGAGTVDLRSEALDIGITPKARQGVGLSVGGTLAGLTRLRGTLAQPSIGVDELGVARQAASVGAAFATAGLSLLGEWALDKATADSQPCQTALGKAAAKRGKAAPAKTGPLDGLLGR